MLWTHPSDLYNAHDYLFGKHQSHLLIQVHLPVTTVLSSMAIYQVHTTAVLVPEKLNHTTQVIGLPRYILVDENREYYVTWNEQLDDNYDGLMYVTDGSLQLRSFDLAPECVSALFQDNAAYIMDRCDFEHNFSFKIGIFGDKYAKSDHRVQRRVRCIARLRHVCKAASMWLYDKVDGRTGIGTN